MTLAGCIESRDFGHLLFPLGEMAKFGSLQRAMTSSFPGLLVVAQCWDVQIVREKCVFFIYSFAFIAQSSVLC